ncbi:hypothetical protein [Actinomadura xylanilytica]|uniref:hypothetical protein n=1 Tax=Actinomadura xylanilytica TaxID=887459 RepID=UPI00255AAED2|nr:hypothetical protein [Actinomadura xylanilytica]MDL4775562.1 hypothetical protein [Actinomadura xylanilytica]
MPIRRAAGTAALAAALLVCGCSEDDGGRTTASASPTASWRPNEFRGPVTNLCTAVSVGTLRRLRVEPSAPVRATVPRCEWQNERGDDVNRHLNMDLKVYEPPQTRLEYSATKEAAYRFRHLPGWEALGPGTPVGGFGDEAKIVRGWWPFRNLQTIRLAIRVRNAVLQVTSQQSVSLSRHRDQVSPLAELEGAAAVAVREALTRLGPPETPEPPVAAPPFAAGEVSDTGEVCEGLTAPGRLVPGITRHGAETADPMTSGCAWSEDDGERPALTIDARAFSPSPLTGETGTQIATALLRRWRGDGSPAPKLGDEARTDHLEFRKGLSRTSRLLVRHRNMLLYVDYDRWHNASKKAMDKETIGIAKAVLGNRT